MSGRSTFFFILGISAVLSLAHVGLWGSDQFDTATKWAITRITALAIAIIALPGIPFALWMGRQPR